MVLQDFAQKVVRQRKDGSGSNWFVGLLLLVIVLMILMAWTLASQARKGKAAVDLSEQVNQLFVSGVDKTICSFTAYDAPYKASCINVGGFTVAKSGSEVLVFDGVPGSNGTVVVHYLVGNLQPVDQEIANAFEKAFNNAYPYLAKSPS